MAVAAEVAAIGDRIILAKNPIHIPQIGVVDMGRGERIVDDTHRIEALPVLPPQNVTDESMQWRQAMLDLLAPDGNCGAREAAIANIRLIDLSAFRINHGRAVCHAVMPTIVE